MQVADLHAYDTFLYGKTGAAYMDATDELIHLYAKQLKIPSFAEYQEVLQLAAPSGDCSKIESLCPRI